MFPELDSLLEAQSDLFEKECVSHSGVVSKPVSRFKFGLEVSEAWREIQTG